MQASHAGPETTLAILRQRFWLTKGRREVKRVLKKCLVCKHSSTKVCEQKMAPLPKERVQIAPAFTNIGLDFTGPLYLKQSGKKEKVKAYVCIFICEDTRCVHFELTNDMTTEEFLQAFRRMANRRGMPSVIRSDNQTTFHKSNKVFKSSKQQLKLTGINPKKVEESLANSYVVWKFISERASHRGGHWERVCRQLKEPLRKVLGKAFLTYTEMYTVLTDIERVINSRPLTHIGDDIRDGRIITPSLLAVNRDLQRLPDDVPKSACVSLKDRYKYQLCLQNHFWDRWQREYLPTLTVRQKWTTEKQPLKIHDVVLVSDDRVPRGQWRLGQVVETFPGTDGLIRTVKVRTKKGVITRPIQRLHLLEDYRPSVFPSSQEPTTAYKFPSIQVPTTASKFPSTQVPTTASKFPSTQVPTTASKFPSTQVPTTASKFPSTQVPTTASKFPSTQVPTTASKFPSTQVPTTASKFPRVQTELTPSNSDQQPRDDPSPQLRGEDVQIHSRYGRKIAKPQRLLYN